MTSNMVRLHVGSMSESLVKDIDDLQKRFERFGTVVKPFELHEKPISNYHYGYVTMELDQGQLEKLRKAFNGIQYKGTKLSVSVARPDFHERWEEDHNRKDTKVAQRKRNEIIAITREKRIQHTGDNPFDGYRNMIGRERKTPRKDLKKMTMRAVINGKMKFSTGKKSKLWGYDKSRKSGDLSYQYKGGEWVDGTGHVLEKVVVKRDVKVIDDDVMEVDEEEEAVEQDEREEDEQGKNKNLLESLMSNFDFEKPVEADKDDNGLSDYESASDFERQGMEEDSSDEKTETDYGVKRTNCVESAQKSLVDDYKNAHPEFLKKESDIPEQVEEEEGEEEFIPSFGEAAEAGDKNETEKLRSLLNPGGEAANGAFSFGFEGEEETEPTEEIGKDEITPVAAVAQALPVAPHKDVGLFFAHFDSPFLVAQTQLNRFKEGRVNDESAYENWFWENRGVLNRTFRKRRKDAVKRHRKKQKQAAII